MLRWPKSTVAHHVNVLAEAGMLRVVRTRRVRAIDERYYGRTAGVFYVGVVNRPGEDATRNQLGGDGQNRTVRVP